MPSSTLITDDFDPVDRSRAVDLGSSGLPNHCVAVVLAADGEEHFVILRYDQGPADYWPEDWGLVAPHEVIGLPVYQEDY